MEPKTIGDRIKIVRKIFGLSQLEFARRLCVTQGHLSTLEKNLAKPSGHLLKLICIEYRISVYWLTDGEGPMYAAKNAAEKMTLDEAAAPLIRWIKQNGDPDIKAVVEAGGVWLARKE